MGSRDLPGVESALHGVKEEHGVSPPLVPQKIVGLRLESPYMYPHVPQLDQTWNVGETDILTRNHYLYIYYAY